MQERLQKYMAACGIASRRKCEEYITEGRVKVNNVTITELGFKIDCEKDEVLFDNNTIEKEAKKVYIALNKPVGYVSTVKDEHSRPTIMDLVPSDERIYPIGRLDYDTSGLLLMTNDGEVYNNVIHPRKAVNKVYIALVQGIPTEAEIKNFCSGLHIGDYVTSDAEFRILKKVGSNSEVEIIIHEGKNRQIRRMCEAINHKVIALKRISVGEIKLADLKTGHWRYLQESEVGFLKNL